MKTMQERVLATIEQLALDNDLTPNIAYAFSNQGCIYMHGNKGVLASFQFNFNPTYVVLNKINSADQLAYAEYHNNAAMAKLYANVEELILAGIG